jgi:predicted secreted hydrolase
MALIASAPSNLGWTDLRVYFSIVVVNLIFTGFIPNRQIKTCSLIFAREATQCQI